VPDPHGILHKPEQMDNRVPEEHEGGDIVMQKHIHWVTVNYCPVCKREYQRTSGNRAGLCPVCGTRLVQITDEEMDTVRRDNLKKKE
jgi:ssDNA-binding Zn-finger/Zn-ribbon topoisomerase 1